MFCRAARLAIRPTPPRFHRWNSAAVSAPIALLTNDDRRPSFAAIITVVALASLLPITTSCEGVNLDSLPDVDQYDEIDSLPVIRSREVAAHGGGEKGVWMSYGGFVYDVTDFVANHPGGSEKIMMAAGGAIEPFWHLYRQHFASDLPLRLMETMIIGKLHPDDQEKIDDEMDKLSESGDPYEHEPHRSPLLVVHSDTPMNAEVPVDILTKDYTTPTNLFYIRHHHPVPMLSQQEIEDFRLEVDLSLLHCEENGADHNTHIAELSLEQVKSLPKVEVVTTLQCSGNRRDDFNELRRTSGTKWGQGAISTAKWGGARLVDVLQLAAEQLPTNTSSDRQAETADDSLLKAFQNLHSILQNQPKLKHLRMESIDGMLTSIDITKALNPFGDVILAYEMNDEPLPRDHGFPLRMIVPGYAAVRNVKWVSRLELHEEPSEGPWQRGLNYKILPPAVSDVKNVNLDEMPGVSEQPVSSGITNVERVTIVGEEQSRKKLKPGDTILLRASGWAWAGGGRNIVRVDVTGDNGKTWEAATIAQGADQPYGRAWAWVFWECEGIPAKVCDDGHSVELSCKGVDMAFNTQPESTDGIWNVRGLSNNSWFRTRLRVV